MGHSPSFTIETNVSKQHDKIEKQKGADECPRGAPPV